MTYEVDVDLEPLTDPLKGQAVVIYIQSQDGSVRKEMCRVAFIRRQARKGSEKTSFRRALRRRMDDAQYLADTLNQAKAKTDSDREAAALALGSAESRLEELEKKAEGLRSEALKKVKTEKGLV